MRPIRLLVSLTACLSMLDSIVLLATPAGATPHALQHWWPAEGTGDDAVDATPVTLQNGAGYGPGVKGTDQAFLFDGVAGSGLFSNTGAGNFGTGDFTIAFFAKVNPTPPGVVQEIWSKREVCGPSQFWDIQTSGIVAGAVSVQLRDDANGNTTNIFGITPIDDASWHHVALVRQGTFAYLYVDGQLDAVGQSQGVGPANSDNAIAMQDATGPCVGFGEVLLSGSLDEQMLWGKALSPAQIRRVIAYLIR